MNSLCNFFYLCVLIAGVSVYLFTGSSAPLQYLPLSARASCEPDADFSHRYYIYLYDSTFTCMMLSHRCGVCSQVESFLCSTAASARRHITCPVSVRASCDMVLILDRLPVRCSHRCVCLPVDRWRRSSAPLQRLPGVVPRVLSTSVIASFVFARHLVAVSALQGWLQASLRRHRLGQVQQLQVSDVSLGQLSLASLRGRLIEYRLCLG